jgi:hypothetical protein
MIKIGEKSKDLEQGYVWAPYILVDSIDIVSAPGFSGAKMSSRYKNPKVEKIKKILEKIEDFKIIS